MRTKLYRRGFTIIEMTLALAFLSILLIAIVTLTVNASKLYVKGITYKEINQAGRVVQDSIRSDFLSADATKVGSVLKVGGSSGTGRICLGQVSYLWNTAAILRTSSHNRIMRNDTPIRIARVVDPNGSMCVKDGDGTYPTDLSSVSDKRFSELLGGEGQDYAPYNVSIRVVDTNGYRGLYHITYTVGTNEKGTTQGSGANISCKPNGGSLNADFTYCAVSYFDMIVRAGGGS